MSFSLLDTFSSREFGTAGFPSKRQLANSTVSMSTAKWEGATPVEPKESKQELQSLNFNLKREKEGMRFKLEGASLEWNILN